jgi:hypothetical protein
VRLVFEGREQRPPIKVRVDGWGHVCAGGTAVPFHNLRQVFCDIDDTFCARLKDHSFPVRPRTRAV